MATLGLRRQSIFNGGPNFFRVSINMNSLGFNSAVTNSYTLPTVSQFYKVSIISMVASIGIDSTFTISPSFTVFTGSTCVFSWASRMVQSWPIRRYISQSESDLFFVGGTTFTIVYRQYNSGFAGDIASLTIASLGYDNG